MFNYFGKKEYAKQKEFASNRDKYLRWLIVPLTRMGVKPDYVTLFSIFLLIMGVLIIPYYTLTGGFCILFYCLLDGIDGGIARYLNIQSPRGSLMDIFADQVAVAIIPIFTIIYFNSNPIFAYLYGFGYIMYIIFLVALNSYGHKVNFVLRVKYPYYFIFWLNFYTDLKLIDWFHYIFGPFYILSSIWLFYNLLKAVDENSKNNLND